MKILVTGAGGMLARALVPELQSRAHRTVSLDHRALDVTDREAVRDTLARERPEVVVQCAAYTAVDAAETQEIEAFRLNAEATGFVAEACAQIGALLVYPSTDYVFSGESRRAYRPDDPTGPLNAYGRSKLEGESAARSAGRALIVRTSWLYGDEGANFTRAIREKAKGTGPLEVVDDEVGRPTWTRSLSRTLGELITRETEGTLHVTDGGTPTSWYGFAEVIVQECGLHTVPHPVRSSAVARSARRPAFSVLDCTATERILGARMPDWRQMLAMYLREDARTNASWGPLRCESS